VLSFADPASTDGRYHRRQGPGVWYASDQEQAAWAELFRHFTEEGVDPFEVRRRVGRVTVEDLEVLDLTNEQVRAILGLTLEDLVGDDYQRTQAVTAAAANAGYQGILAPSAALDGRRTLVVFAAGVPQLIPGRSRVRQAPPRLAGLLHRIRPHPDVSLAVRELLSALADVGTEVIRRRRKGGAP